MKNNLAFEIADSIVNQGGYADDPKVSDTRAEERDRLVPIIQREIDENNWYNLNISAAREFLNVAATNARIAEQSMDFPLLSSITSLMHGIAFTMAIITGADGGELIQHAKNRATRIVRDEDWRRELELFRTYCEQAVKS